MMWLYLATGFTGALTAVFLGRELYRKWADAPSVTAYFSPKGGCTEAVVAALGRARKEVLVLAHAFSSEPLAKAVLDAKMRGAGVTLLFDRDRVKDPACDLHLFAAQGLAPLVDTHFPRVYNSLIVIDGRVLIAGSFDFTRPGEEENATSLLVIAGHPELIAAHRNYFFALKAHAEEFRPAAPEGKPSAEPPRQAA